MNSTKTLKSIIVVLLLALGFSLYYNSLKINQNESLCVDYSQYNLSTLKTGVIGDMINTYKQNQLPAMNSSLGRNETRAVLFDLDTIQKFIYHIKKEVEKNSMNSAQEKLGLRLYYAAYPNSGKFGTTGYEELGGIPLTYGERLTAVFIPSRINSSNVVVDFNPSDPLTYTNGIPKYTIDGLTGIITPNDPLFNEPAMAITGSSNSTMARNHGTIYPPGVPTVTSKLSFD